MSALPNGAVETPMGARGDGGLAGHPLLRRLFLIDEERAARQRGADAQARLEVYARRARRRFDLAAYVVDEGEDSEVALAVLRDAVVLHACAWCVAANRPIDVPSLVEAEDPTSFVREAHAAAGFGGLSAAQSAALGMASRARTLDVSEPNGLSFKDAMGELRALAARFEAAYDARSARALRATRVARSVAITGLVVAAVWAGLASALRLPNVALGKPVSASAFRDGPSVGQRLVNGVEESPYAVVTADEVGAWVRVDLGGPTNLRKVIAHGRSDEYRPPVPPPDMTLEVSEDGATYAPLARHSTFVGAKPFEWSGSAKGRFIRLRVEGRGTIVLSELEVRGR